MEPTSAVIGLLGLIATINTAQFALTLEHRGRIAHVESTVERLSVRLADSTDDT